MSRSVFLIILLLLPASLMAGPVYTRQTGAACKLCHYADMHSLNAYGRAFTLNGHQETAQMLEERREFEGKQTEAKPSTQLPDPGDKGGLEDHAKADAGDEGILSEDWELDMIAPPDDGLPEAETSLEVPAGQMH